ncbi:substrate-binding domain-containing protein (plasmid) [Chloroflexota bacterium]|nr:substrate-binding domain-containing protein [Chloroflexota bacterium]
MKKASLTVLAILVIIPMVLSACATPAVETTEPVVDETEVVATEEVVETEVVLEPVKVGVIADLTGALAIYGVMIPRSFMLGMEYATGAAGTAGDVFDFAATQENTFMLDGREIQVYVRDDAGSPENTTAVANELIDVVGVDFLVGSTSSSCTATLQEIAFDNQIPLIVAPAAANDITGKDFNEYTFRTSRNNYQDSINECAALTENYSTFVTIAIDNTFGKGAAESFRDACTLDGGEFVTDDIYAPADTTDFTPYMEIIADTDAEAYIVAWAGSGFIPLVQAAEDQGVNETKELGTTFIDNILMPVFYSNAVGTTAGILYHYSAPDNVINDFLVENLSTRYGVYPDLFDADAMNAAIMVVEALKATNGDTDGATLVAAMEGLSFDGPKGLIEIRPEDHVAIQDMYILTLENLTDPTFNFYSYVGTTRPVPPCLLTGDNVARCGDLPVGSLSGE